MNIIETRSTSELRRLRDRATNETIRELLNAELCTRFRVHPATLNNYHKGTVWVDGKPRSGRLYPHPGQP